MDQITEVNLESRFEDEFAPEGERYLEAFQEALFSRQEPSPMMLESLQHQPKDILVNLKDVLTDVMDQAEPENTQKYSAVLKKIDSILEA